MTQEHPITPPPELVEKWIELTRSNDCIGAYPQNYEHLVATQAARWGADQELDACCEWLQVWFWQHEDLPKKLRATRRPKPPSLKEQALQALANADGADHPVVVTVLTADEHALIRKALESLPE